MIARLLGMSRRRPGVGWLGLPGRRAVALAQVWLLAWLPVVGAVAEPSVCAAAGSVMVRLTLVDGSTVEGKLVTRAPSGYVVLVGSQERRFPYHQVQEADEWAEGSQPAAPPAQPDRPSGKPGPVLEPPPAAEPAPRPKPIPDRYPPRRPRTAPALEGEQAPEVPSRGMSTVGWILFGVSGGAATLIAMVGRADDQPQYEAVLVLGAVTGVALAAAGIARRAEALQRLNKWRRARGLPELDEPPDDASQLYLPERPLAPPSGWAVAPAWAPGGGALVLTGTF